MSQRPPARPRVGPAQLVEFLDVFTGDAFDVKPETAIAYFTAKGLKPTFSYMDMLGEAHDQAFTVAKMMDVDLLGQVRKSLDDALTTGESFAEWKRKLQPTLEKAGWLGKDADGNQLGSPWRLETIFRTNMQTAYAVGQWEEIVEQAEVAPFLMYDAVDDSRTRPEHAAWDRKVLPVTHKWWQSHFPPNGYNCRCSVIQLDAEEVEALGLEIDTSAPADGYYNWTNPKTGDTLRIPNGIDPGFDRNPGKVHLDNLAKILGEKIGALPPDMSLAAAKAMESILDRETAKKLAAEAKEQAAQETAAKAINEAAVNNKPWLAAAIKSVQSSPAGKKMKPTELLQAATEKAAKTEQAHQLYDYKKAVIAGKEPNQKAKQAFAALSPDEQSAIGMQIANQAAKNAAQEALDKLAAGEGNLKQKQALKQLQASGDADKLGPVQLLAEVDKLAADMQAKAVATAAVNAYKKNAIAGKIPSPLQKQAFDALPDDKKAELLDEIDKAKAPAPAPATLDPGPAPAPVQAPAASSAKAVINPQALTQIGPQKGSNPGGLYQDTETGVQWYVKQPGSADKVRNEVLAGKLYEAAGIEVPDLQISTLDGKPAIASRIIDGLSKGNPNDLATAPGGREGFVVDAWLGNWDVVGMGYDNMLLRAGKAVRVDTGGALRYRAQGTLKGDAWNDSVDEIDSLRNPGTNSQAASVFGGITEEELLAGARRVLAIDEKRIRELVLEYGPVGAGEREALVRTLLARQASIARRFPDAVKKPKIAPPPADVDGLVSVAEQKTIQAARTNGYAIRTDGGDIEDHNVTVSVFKTPKGELTRAHFKMLPDAGKRLEKQLAGAAGEATIIANPQTLAPRILELVVGINSRANKGGAFEQKTIDRWTTLAIDIDAQMAELGRIIQAKPAGVDLAAVKAQREYLLEWQEKIDAVLTGAKATDKAKAVAGKFDQAALKAITQAPETSGGTGLAWQRLPKWEVETTEITRGFATLTGKRQTVPGVSRVYRAEIDGVRIDYVPFEGNDSGRSFQGTVHIDAQGASPEVTERAIRQIEKLGITTRRATDIDRRELYINRVARLHTVRNPGQAETWKALDSIADQGERIQKKLARINGWTGKDLTESPYWSSYTGTYQAFGHGRALQYRPDLDEAEFLRFTKDHVLYNNPTGLGRDASTGMWGNLQQIFEGGGMYSSRADMVRRGIPMASGTSVSSDIRTGGGNYIFTRIRKAAALKNGKHAGIFWKASHMRRLDAISYDSDNYGDTTDSTQRYARKTTPAEWREIAGDNSNETIFKDGMSLFDDVESIIFPTPSELKQALEWFRGNGYQAWPDGRQLEDVLKVRK